MSDKPPSQHSDQQNPYHQSDLLAGELFFYGAADDIYQVTVFEPALPLAPVPETLIHALWRYQQFDHEGLQSTHGDTLRVLRIGAYNLDAGPDFLNAAVEINGTAWYGDIELHRTSSEWFTHKHHKNVRYNSTILHVTLFQDAATGTLTRQDNSLIPELVLGPRLQSPLRSLLHAHHTAPAHALPCTPYLHRIAPETVSPWIDELGTRRMLRKKENVERAFMHTPNLEDILHQLLFTGLGYAKNCGPMAALARRIPLHVARTLNAQADIEALHFGVSGLLPLADTLEQQDAETAAYAAMLYSRFKKINAAFKLTPLPATHWQFFRLRPANFPTRRVAQAAALYHRQGQKKGILHAECLDTIAAIFTSHLPRAALAALKRCLQCKTAPYWQTHYQFKTAHHADPSAGVQSIDNLSMLGDSRASKLILNAICPVMLVYADQNQMPALEQAIFQLLNHARSERDRVIKAFRDLTLTSRNARISQGLHELHEHFCSTGKCLSCKIGNAIINNNLSPTT